MEIVLIGRSNSGASCELVAWLIQRRCGERALLE